jgi:hypothetical protein
LILICLASLRALKAAAQPVQEKADREATTQRQLIERLRHDLGCSGAQRPKIIINHAE